MFRDHNMCSGLDHHHDNILCYLESMTILQIVTSPSFVLHPPLFDWLNEISCRPCNIFPLSIMQTSCRIFICIMGQGPSNSKVKWPSWLPIIFQASIEGVSQAVTHRYYDQILWSNFYITLLGLVIPWGVHSIVTQNTTCATKKPTFSKLHHQNGSKFHRCFFMSRYTQYLLQRKKW